MEMDGFLKGLIGIVYCIGKDMLVRTMAALKSLNLEKIDPLENKVSIGLIL